MASGNCTTPTAFSLTGLTENPRLQIPLFMLFLAIYITTLTTNLGLTALISIDLQLQTPMYFFLQNLSFTDAVYSTVITPKMLATFLEETKTISYGGCILQYFSFILLTTMELLLLAVMAYDRYVAICKPLLYTAIMTKVVCWRLVKGLYFVAFELSLVHTSSLLKLSFCSSNVVNHFFCDISPLFLISSPSTALNELLVFIFGSLFLIINIISTLISYIFIILTVLRIRSKERKYKAFSTCTSHLMAVFLFHGTFIFMYLRPVKSFSLDKDKLASLFYTVVIPMLNPLIYSWRNKEVKDSLRRVIATNVWLH
ncbi:LOW QUALITY PROTEIN: olfactory receptor-like protein COR4 [Phasianus colchicus]|uniref:LOW QUALITY PROTEIN: olfactory receptor-like protein COR4 n=1 Tax=Phasianus colchicus TaxID=9054 RepID=UPI00129EB598|nr:LOW QUALITY PROTEIN: olfactory receptor-like protein COR4 [Phasianus colchicus]